MPQEPIPAPDRIATPEMLQAQAEAGLRAFFRIMEAWRVKSREARVLLGQPPERTFYDWKRGRIGSITFDTLRRISYVLGIYKALQILYRDPDMADRWVQTPNRFFGGQSALDRMLGGDVADLYVVREYLDAARGGWQ